MIALTPSEWLLRRFDQRAPQVVRGGAPRDLYVARPMLEVVDDHPMFCSCQYDGVFTGGASSSDRDLDDYDDWMGL